MLSSGSVLFIVLLMNELRVFKYIKQRINQVLGLCNLRDIFKRKKKSPRPLSIYTDSDVYAEADRVAMMPPDQYKNHNLILQDLVKFYNKFLAVNQLNVAIDPYECFGLLGINGAGKTTTFKMLIGDEKMSSGDSFVQGISLKKDMKGVHKRIGYCPQFDALIDDLTGRETLDFFCMLRGVRRMDIKRVSTTLATDLNFMQHIDKLVREYSGGNKRKLSTAVAMLGNPSVIFLDEPTTGMDPGAKRHLWSAICKVRNQGRSIVLTSHSMEECEALCTRIAIMVGGEFRCLGSVQHLKSKFSKGFILTIKIKCLDETNIRETMGNRR
jgi:ATP-binding cassette, subfamily A (ABC1), member 3